MGTGTGTSTRSLAAALRAAHKDLGYLPTKPTLPRVESLSGAFDRGVVPLTKAPPTGHPVAQAA